MKSNRDSRINFYLKSCITKTRFSDESYVKQKAKEYGLEYYYCSVCAGFHLTKKAKGIKSHYRK